MTLQRSQINVAGGASAMLRGWQDRDSPRALHCAFRHRCGTAAAKGDDFADLIRAILAEHVTRRATEGRQQAES